MQQAEAFRIIFMDEQVLVVEKPSGMVVHPTYKHPDGTLADAVAAWAVGQNRPRPWLIHRLDRDTSGVVLFAWTAEMTKWCARQFEDHRVRKQYAALVWGSGLPDVGRIDLPLKRDPADRRRVISAEDGQSALTRFAVIRRYPEAMLVHLWPETGRTHQLRAHMHTLGHPIAGDPVYAGEYPPLPRLLLHAVRLDLPLPGRRQRTFLAPIPPEFATILAALDQQSLLADDVTVAPVI